MQLSPRLILINAGTALFATLLMKKQKDYWDTPCTSRGDTRLPALQAYFSKPL